MSLRSAFSLAAVAMTQAGGEIVSYQQRMGGPPLTLHAVFVYPEDVGFSGMGTAGRATVRVEALIAASDIAPGRPEVGDLIAIGGEKGWRVGSVRQDATGALFTLGLARQD
jgi:hypothetical protein